MARGIIYLILNKQTGEKYIGNTTLAMNKEWVHHIERSKRMSPEPLHKAFRQYGTHNFMMKELDECDESEFTEKTNHWIEQYKPEYNPAEGISASAIVEKAEESIQVLREDIKPIKKQSNHKASLNLIKWNEHTRGDGKKTGFKIKGKNLETGVCTEYPSAREAATQVTGNPNNRANILSAARHYRIAYGHRWQLLEERQQKKPVFGVNKKTEQIEVRFESINSAIRSFEGTDKNGILKSLKNPGRYTWKGYWWYYG
jgi:group I intron endonuclease